MTNLLSQKWLTACLSIGIVIALAGGYWLRQKREKEYVFVELRAFPTPSGWGYDILQDGRPWCHQDYIPSVTGHRVFRTKEDALAAGKIVFDKAVAGQLPDITEAEMRSKGIFIPPLDSAAEAAQAAAAPPKSK